MATPLQPQVPSTQNTQSQQAPKLIVDVNKNKTKKGIKVQFELGVNTPPDQKQKLQSQLQTRLNKGLTAYNLAVNVDNDVPYGNIIGFTIPIDSIKMLIKNALNGIDNRGERITPEPSSQTSSPSTPTSQQASGVPVGGGGM